ncbi:MAG TPA: S8 family serine peptidase [Steroidobacteraceae bacterium]|nr:S8 family serine peptidase [Steroidobacteraceae bacterium]
MRALAQLCAVAAVLLVAAVSLPARADDSSSRFDSGHQFVVVTFANVPHRPAARAGTTGRRYAGDSYGVAQNAHDQARRVASAYSLRQVASWPIKELSVHCVVYEITDSRPLADVLTALSRDPRVTLAQPLQEFRTLTADSAAGSSTYNDPLYGLQTNMVRLGIAAAHERTQGAGVRVGLIDTGVDASHPDLQDRIARSSSFVGGNSPATAAYRHGTAMAGLIAAVANNRIGMVGIAPLARIEVFEACWQLEPNSDAAACNTFTLAQALAAAIESRVPLINLSIAGPPDPLLGALVQSGLKRGVIFVGSVSAQTGSFPTSVEGVIGAGSSEQQQPGASLYAPATHVLTLRPAAQYDFESGTSVAAAEVTGMIALLLSLDSRLTADSAVALLKGTGAQSVALDAGAAVARLEAARGNSRLASRSLR